MKNRNIKQTLIILFMLISSPLAAQTPKPTEKKNEENKQAATSFQDLNANGIDDAKENQQSSKKQHGRMRDQFIDANGDGICDNREQGLGFRRGKGQSTNQTGKRQQGRQK
jgi:hypothetical protein